MLFEKTTFSCKRTIAIEKNLNQAIAAAYGFSFITKCLFNMKHPLARLELKLTCMP